MPIYNFAADAGQINPAQFSSILMSHRSDIEQTHTPLALHNSESADIKFARAQAKEMINVSGAAVIIYMRTENADIDIVWDEDADPTYWNPVNAKGFFKPQPLEAELKQWGAEVINKTEIVFAHQTIYTEIGERMLRTGDVIKLPYNSATINLNPQNYRVLNASPTGNFRYTWLYLTCQLETLTADITVRPEKDLPEEIPLQFNEQYRESI